MDNIYRENILDHFNRPRNFGHIHRPDYFHEEENTLCGDRIRMEIKLKIKDPCLAGRQERSKIKTITEIRFFGEGCAICMASASMLTEKVKGVEISKVKKITSRDMLNLLGITFTPVRVKCALLPLEVLQKILLFVKMK